MILFGQHRALIQLDKSQSNTDMSYYVMTTKNYIGFIILYCTSSTASISKQAEYFFHRSSVVR